MAGEPRQRHPGVAADLGAVEIWSAISLWRQIGRAEFLERFAVGSAARYVVVDGPEEFDALALLVGARHLSGRSVSPAYRADRRSVAEPLKALGFFVEAIDGREEVPIDIRAFNFASWLARFDGVTEQETLTKRRREQSALRATLGLQPNSRGTCGLCGRELPAALLAAAHIKPRSECSRRERTDAPWVVMPACRLGCDSLFELGYLAVDHLGAILVSTDCPISFDTSDVAPAWREERERYFAWHRRHRLRA